jgi:hypothetical protein
MVFHSVHVVVSRALIVDDCFRSRAQKKKQTSGREAHIFLGAEQSDREVDWVLIYDEDTEVSLYRSSSH